MALFSVDNVSIEGISAAVPKQQFDNLELELLSPSERTMFVKTVGIRYRRVAEKLVTASDLCFAAAQKLLKETNTRLDDIAGIVLVTQTPDYLIPNTSSILQHQLGLSKTCIAFDINLGCSGYIYGLSVVSALLSKMPGKKFLLLVGDVSTKVISHNDKSVVPLFSDAGSATLLSHREGSIFHFNLQTDGSEFDDIIIPDGGMRKQANPLSFSEQEIDKGISRSALHMKLDGIKIFNFSLREVTPNIKELYEYNHLSFSSTDYFVFHQANQLMLETIRKKLNIETDKVPYSLYEFGNTSSASIPLTIVSKLRNEVMHKRKKLLLSGFGVGLSWGSMFFESTAICVPEIIEL